LNHIIKLEALQKLMRLIIWSLATLLVISSAKSVRYISEEDQEGINSTRFITYFRELIFRRAAAAPPEGEAADASQVIRSSERQQSQKKS